MELRQLQYFAAVARHRHFGRAAAELYVTQPALSQQVRRLEAELGLELLRRGSRGVELTPAGAELLARAEAILAEVERARAEMDRHAGVTRGVVRVAAGGADAPRLAEALAAFHREHPGVRLALRQGSAAEAVELIRTGSVDLAVAALRESDAAGIAGVDVRQLAEEPLRVVVAEGDPLESAGPIALEDLRGRTFVLAEPGTALRELVMAACQAAGFSPVPLLEVGDPWTTRLLVSAGLGVSLVPLSWVERPGPAVGVARLAGRAPCHRLSLLTPAAGSSPVGGLLAERLLQHFGELG
jgi:DNA-binding transcriptional LysR family regulator